MKKCIILLFIILPFLTINAQNELEPLINVEYISNIGYGCEETPEPDPCAGVQMYLILKFTEESVSIIEKDISSCGSEYITCELEYKWEMSNNNEITIQSNPKEIEYKFLKDLVLKIENKKMVGYKKYWNNRIKKIIFEKNSEK